MVRAKGAVFKRQGAVGKGRTDPAVCMPKLLTRRAEVTTNIECERVRLVACNCARPIGRTQMRYTVVCRRAEIDG